MEQNKQKQISGRWKLLAVVAVCASPLIFSYLTYYDVIPVSGSTNYGTLLDPRKHPMPALGTTALDGKPLALDAYKGKWIMLQAAPGNCQQACKDQLVKIRQLRTMQGKHMGRIERVWLITDDTPLDIELMKVIDGARFLRVKPEVVKAWLPVEPGGDVSDHLYLVDPLGNLMMRYPKNPPPEKVSKDLGKLLKASSIG